MVTYHVCKDCVVNKTQLEVNSQEDSRFEHLNMYFYNSIFQSVENENISINGETLEWIHLKSKMFSVNFDKPVLVFRYSIYSCTSCIDFIYDKLMISFDYKLDNVSQLLFLTSDSNPLLKGKISQTINMVTRRLDIPIEREDIPFVFILDNGEVKNLFVPDTSFPEYMEFYLKEIKKKYFT